MRPVDPCSSWKCEWGFHSRRRDCFPKNHQVRWDIEENWPLNRQEQKAKIPRPHRASWELSVEGRPGLWVFCPPDCPQGHVHHPGHLAVPLTWGFPLAPRVSLPEDATGLSSPCLTQTWITKPYISWHSWRPWSPLRQRGMWWEQMRMGGSWTTQSRTFWGWIWARSNEEAQITVALYCSLGRFSWAGIFERLLSSSERLSFLFWGNTWKCSPIGIFSPWNFSTSSRTTSGNFSRPGANYTSTAHQSSRVRASPFLVFF